MNLRKLGKIVPPWHEFASMAVAADADRAQRLRKLENKDYEGVSNPLISEFLLQEIKVINQTKLDGLRDVEAKATAQISIVGGGLGLISLVTPKLVTHTVINPAVAVIGTMLLLASIASNFACILPRTTTALPTLDEYNDTEIVKRPDMKARIQLEINEALLVYSYELSAVGMTKGNQQRWGTGFFIGAVVVLVANFLLVSFAGSTPDVPLPSSSLRISPSSAPLHVIFDSPSSAKAPAATRMKKKL